MTDRQELHELRQRAHDAGIEGNSKMSEQQLRAALQKIDQGMSPQRAKQETRR
ncbi:hypothetical protein [Micromonospora echinofusca]|uniref:Uncharacterized protein n=1 Tax=Micromonospora echinofusca TaxID=47858 RepID=A0ABS3VJ84_MICEH|nr:hypothetical protein [Micromonospora echinofusca]MBO4204582.1 hypothetical protein [Micromonospora echinofusca]